MTTLATDRRTLADQLRDAAIPLTGAPGDFDRIMARAATARLVLIGEASHGTHEFYRIRGEITKRLIREHGFNAVAVEADWPDAYRVNRYVRGATEDGDADEALSGFKRFPQWMWRNADVLDFVGWLRAHNDGVAEKAHVGFYGLDLYSLHASAEAVLSYLRVVDPPGALRALQRYSCFDHFGEDVQAYGYATSAGLAPSCETAVVEQLVDMRRSAPEYARREGRIAADDLFYAEQNARIVLNAERYYRAMFGSRAESWNLRDRHMMETLDALLPFLGRTNPNPRVVVWAHNSHLGDARATEMGSGGELNLGQLVRERFAAEALLVGFSTYTGTVSAAHEWDSPVERKLVRPGLPGSYEALFHDTALPRFLLDLGEPGAVTTALRQARLQRAIGVIYRPETERLSHYFHAVLPSQFDIMVHYDTTRAVEPLERTPLWARGDVPETFPTAL